MNVNIRNFDKYNPRKDQKSSSWFRVENEFTIGQDFHNFDSDGKIIWLTLLGMASKKMSADIYVDENFISHVLKIDMPKVSAILSEFHRLEFIVIENHVVDTLNTYPYVSVRARTDSHATNERTNETNGTNVTTLPARTRTKKQATSLSTVSESPPLRSGVESKKYTDDDLEIGRAWLKYATREMSWTKPQPSWTEEKFAADIAKVRKATDLNQEGFFALLNFIENDDFWVKNAWSPAGLLKNGANDVRKVDTILGRMKPASMRQHEKMQDWDENTKSPFDRS
jgi:hypothetical protein